MNKSLKIALFSCILLSLFASSLAQTCQNYTFHNNAVYSNCSDLGRLNSSLHWTYDSDGEVNMAFRHTNTTTSRWTAWAINPDGQRMAGSQSLVAFQNSIGLIQAYTSSIDSHNPSMAQGDLSFQVTNLMARFENNEMIIFATLHLPSNLSSTNHVWQEGPVSGDTLGTHPKSGDNVISVGTVNFQTGQTSAGRARKRNKNGVLIVVSWGILMPMGAMMARHLKKFKSAWFYLHVACQFSAYIVGVVGWATAHKLCSDSPGNQHHTQRTIGTVRFILGTLQVCAGLLMPKNDDSCCWKWFHRLCGYTTIILSIVTIFVSFDNLAPEKKSKWIYTGIFIILGATQAILEGFSRFFCS